MKEVEQEAKEETGDTTEEEETKENQGEQESFKSLKVRTKKLHDPPMCEWSLQVCLRQPRISLGKQIS